MRSALALAAVLVLAGCSLPAIESPFQRPTERETSPGRTSADEMLAYVGRLTALRESALPAEAARQREVMQRDASNLTRVKAALALALASPGDDAELHALVEPVARASGGDADVRSMASFLQALAAERRRARESAAAAAVRLRDERRASETQKQRADALQERATQLQQKLDALTEIEKSLSDRQGTPR